MSHAPVHPVSSSKSISFCYKVYTIRACWSRKLLCSSLPGCFLSILLESLFSLELPFCVCCRPSKVTRLFFTTHTKHCSPCIKYPLDTSVVSRAPDWKFAPAYIGLGRRSVLPIIIRDPRASQLDRFCDSTRETPVSTAITKMHVHMFSTALAFAGTALALPTMEETRIPTRTVSKRGAAAVVEAIMPKSTDCSSRGDECATADVAGPVLADSMTHFGITSGAAQAGILSLVAYESNELQYRKNLDQSAQLGRGTVNE